MLEAKAKTDGGGKQNDNQTTVFMLAPFNFGSRFGLVFFSGLAAWRSVLLFSDGMQVLLKTEGGSGSRCGSCGLFGSFSRSGGAGFLSILGLCSFFSHHLCTRTFWISAERRSSWLSGHRLKSHGHQGLQSSGQFFQP